MVKHVEYGYVRMSGKDRGGEAQLKALREAGVSSGNLFVDQPDEKEKFGKLEECVKPGDVLVIKSLAQLGGSYREIMDGWVTFTNKLNAHIRVLDTPLLDTSVKMKHPGDSFVSDVFLQLMTFASQREQAYIKYRQKEGIAYAKRQGRHLGRPRIPKPLKFDEMYNRWRAGEISAEEALTRLNLKRSTFERFVKERKEELKKELGQQAS